MYKKVLLVLSILLFSLLLCTKVREKREKVIFTSIEPIKYLVVRIVGGEFKVYSLIERNRDPHSFTVTPEQMSRLSDAVVFFTVGLESEKSIISKINKMLPEVKIVQLTEENVTEDNSNFSKQDILTKENEFEIHNEIHSHSNGKDPHVWTSLVLLKKICFTINEYLTELEPTKKELFNSNLKKIIAEIDSVDLLLKSSLLPFKNRKFFVFHPSFGYFADDYGLIQVAVEVDGKEPSVKEMKNIIEMAKKEKPFFIFVEPQFSKRSVLVIAKELGCEIFTVDPLAENIVDELYNFGSALKRNFESVR